MLARGLIDELKAAKGSVVNVTSIAGSRVHPFAGSAYATSKAALVAVPEMAFDFGSVGVRVSLPHPVKSTPRSYPPRTEVSERSRSHWLGTPDEVAENHLRACAPRPHRTSTAPKSTSMADSTFDAQPGRSATPQLRSGHSNARRRSWTT